MTTTADYTVERAVQDSIRENRTIELTATIDSTEWVNLAESLLAAADDYSEEIGRAGAVVRDYWGTDEDGDAFRIRLIGTR